MSNYQSMKTTRRYLLRRQADISETIGESRLGMALFCKQGFERILDRLEREALKIQGPAVAAAAAAAAVRPRSCYHKS